MSAQQTPLHRTLEAIPDPARRAELAKWAAEHGVAPEDPLWAALRLTILSDHWSRQNVAALQKSAEAVRKEIEAASEQAIFTVANQARAAAEESRQAIQETLTRLVTQVGLNLDRETTQAIRRAESGGWWGWTAAVSAAVLTGSLMGLLAVAGPTWVDRLRGFAPEASPAYQLGADLMARWDRLDEAQQRQVAGILGWMLVPRSTPLQEAPVKVRPLVETPAAKPPPESPPQGTGRR
jgi:hypothetical protein